MFSEAEKEIHDALVEHQSIIGVYFSKCPNAPQRTVITVDYMTETPWSHRISNIMTFRDEAVEQDPDGIVKLFLNDIEEMS